MNIATYPKYESYHDTGFPPVGEIPAHWGYSRIRHAVELSPSRRLDRNIGRDHKVVFLPMEAVGDNGQIDQSHLRLAKEVSEGFTYFQRGDVIMAKITPCFENGKGAHLSNLTTSYGFGTTELHVMRPREVIGEFLYYFLNRSAFRSYSEVFMVGSAGQKRVSTDFLKNQIIPLPPLHEQRVIAAFLDGKCATIDEAVRIKEEQIRLLAERRQILIQQAVTRGLNPDTSMKDSGIDWIGQIPAHWEAIPLKRLFRERNERTKTGEETLLSLRMVEGLVPHDDVSDKAISDADLVDYKKVFLGQMVMNRMRASIGLFGIVGQLGLVSPDYAIFDMRDDLYGPFFLNLFKIDQMGTRFRLSSRGLGTGSSGFMRLYTDDFGAISVPVPPSAEQKEIVNYIAGVEDKIGGAIALKQSQITALREYKESLINAAVTGKIKVS